METAVAIVQPKFVFGAWQAVLEFYHVAYVDGGYGGVRWWITDRRAVVQTVPRTSLAQVSWYLDREVCRIRDLETWIYQQQFSYVTTISIDERKFDRNGQGRTRMGRKCNFARVYPLSTND